MTYLFCYTIYNQEPNSNNDNDICDNHNNMLQSNK